MIIDWMSFTVSFPNVSRDAGIAYLDECAKNALAELASEVHTWGVHASHITIAKPQRPYTNCFACSTSGLKIHYSRERYEALITCDGAACGWLKEAQAVGDMLNFASGSITRLDLAFDVKTNITPKMVLAAGISARFKSISEISSGKGETVYVGSRTGEFMMRNYRYYEPHPRSNLLRFEFELKGDQAKATAQQVVNNGIAPVVRGFGNRMGFVSPQVKEWFAGKYVDVKTAPHNRNLAKTELWLIKQAVPAFHRLVRENVIEDPREWINQHLLWSEKDVNMN